MIRWVPKALAWVVDSPLALPRYLESLTRTAWRDEPSIVPAQPLLLVREGQRRLLLHAYSLAAFTVVIVTAAVACDMLRSRWGDQSVRVPA